MSENKKVSKAKGDESLNLEYNKIVSMDYVSDVDELMDYISPIAQQEKKHRPSLFLSRLIQKRMRENNWDDQRLANELYVDIEIAQLLKLGILPGDQYDNDLINSIARLLEYHPKNIAQMIGMGEKFSTDKMQEELDSKNQLARYFLDQLGEVLFDTIEDRYSQKIEENERLRTKYDQVIQKLQRIVARQRKELKFVEELIASLESTDKSHVQLEVHLSSDAHDSSESLTVVKKRIKRIKDYFETVDGKSEAM